ncbi:penicillin-binding protein activator [Candidatus Photodesmus blepharus]|uniref:Penicillin-binding protein activator n=1 Tax=Candidatus Photodesmus blepharonis TaxID=1179155 RepID=A0A084CMQ5_9GAMM|nr:penicillin-binding protein activator [Candidatus Photodesmus blepharus]KEY91084.1 penicillin-binding protein activator [Candidatus Photodesmus blepharus]
MVIKNYKKISFLHSLTLVSLIITLLACSSKPLISNNIDITLDALGPAQEYLIESYYSKGDLKNNWLIMALKAAINHQDLNLAQDLNNHIIKQSLSEVQKAELKLIKTKWFMTMKQSETGLSQLYFHPNWKLPNKQWKKYHEIRAKLYAEQHNYFFAAKELIKLTQYETIEQQNKIATMIWNYLNRYDKQEIANLNITPEEKILNAWIELTLYTKKLSNNIPKLKKSLQQWFTRNPHHPAALHTPQAIIDILSIEITQPINIALFLPLSGPFIKQAQLIRNGFIIAMMNDKKKDTDTKLIIIDSYKTSMQTLKITLIKENIDFIVGPLTKDNVKKLEQIQVELKPHIQVLALNIPNNFTNKTSTCYLTLSPEQEVTQAAKYLLDQGFEYPLILAPQGHLGKRIIEAFITEWKKYNNNKVKIGLFGDKDQLQQDINVIFGLEASKQNIIQIEHIIQIPLKSQPRSHRDIDSIYIVANNSELTLIKPFIEVAINPDARPPKLFANSYSNNGSKQYEDLTGIEYSDIPFLLQPDILLQTQMEMLWKNSNAEKRLQALGMDAYTLIKQLPKMKLIDGYSINGKTGLLTIDDQCVIQRKISWGKHGVFSPLEHK